MNPHTLSKLHATRELLQQGLEIKPGKLNVLQQVLDDVVTRQQLLLFLLKLASRELPDTPLVESYFERVNKLVAELNSPGNFECLQEIAKQLNAIQPSYKRLHVHASRRRVQYFDLYLLEILLMGLTDLRAHRYYYSLEAAKLFVFDYVDMRYRVGSKTLPHWNAVVEYWHRVSSQQNKIAEHMAGCLSASSLLKKAGEDIYRRGRTYWKRGRVKSIVASNDGITAQVQGDEVYQVVIYANKNKLRGTCTCPAAKGGRFCKHAVATGLAWLVQNGQVIPEEPVCPFKPSDRVMHFKFGLGTVERIDENNGETLVEVIFDKGESQRLALSYAQLKIASEKDEADARAKTREYDPACFEEPQAEEFYGLGNIWSVLGDTETVTEQILLRFPEIISEAIPFISVRDTRPPRAVLPATEPTGACLGWPSLRQGMALVLQLSRSVDEPNLLVSWYPWISEGVEHSLHISKVHLWPSRLEAIVEGVIDGMMEVEFFDTLFARHREYYQPEKEYRFVLAGFAYSCGKVETPEVIIIDKPDAIRRHRQILHDMGGDDDPDDASPLELHTESMAMFLPLQGGLRNEYSFSGTIKSVRETEWMGLATHVFRTTIGRHFITDADIDLDIYVTPHCLKGDPPRPCDDLRGTLWLQGYLWWW